MRLIDANAIPWQYGKGGDVVVYPDTIAQMPTIEPERKGKWIHERLCSSTGGTYPVTRCSMCQNAMPFEWETQYCPNCGCKMEVEE